MVEPNRDITGDFNMLALVVTDGNLVGIVKQDVGCLKGGVCEQAGRDELGLSLCRLVFELGHPTQFTERHGALHDPAELTVFCDMALHKNRRNIRIQTDGEQHRCQLQSIRADQARLFSDRQRMQVDDAVKNVGFVLAVDPISQGSQIVAKVNLASGLNARQNASHATTLPADFSRHGEVISLQMKYAVSTPTFAGPFELLLHLILREEVDIHEVSLSNIVGAYLEEVSKMQSMDLDIATEFLLIAATLIELKARRLLPGKNDGDLDDELALWEERDLLLARLLDCKTFKDVAAVFNDLVDRADLSFPRVAGPDERFARLVPDLLEGVTPLRVQRAFMRATAPKSPKVIGLEHIAPIRASVADAIVAVADQMQHAGRSTFRELVAGIADRIEIVVRFLAILELFKQGRVELDQLERFGDIQVVWLGVEDSSIAIDNYEG